MHKFRQTWRRVRRGFYVWAGLAESPTHALASVHRRLPDGAAFSGRTAAWLHGLDLTPCDPIEITIPDTCGPTLLAGVSVSRSELSQVDVTERRGLPVTSMVRTLADLSSALPLVEAVVAADVALHASLVDLADLQNSVASHARRKGIARLRKVVDYAEPAAESPMETRLRMLLVLAGLPRPRAQTRLYDDRGRYVGRPDLYYPACRLGIEYDGGTHRDSLAQDDRRQNGLLSAGYRLLRFTAADIHRTPDSVVQLVQENLTLHGRGA